MKSRSKVWVLKRLVLPESLGCEAFCDVIIGESQTSVLAEAYGRFIQSWWFDFHQEEELPLDMLLEDIFNMYCATYEDVEKITITEEEVMYDWPASILGS